MAKNTAEKAQGAAEKQNALKVHHTRPARVPRPPRPVLVVVKVPRSRPLVAVPRVQARATRSRLACRRPAAATCACRAARLQDPFRVEYQVVNLDKLNELFLVAQSPWRTWSKRVPFARTSPSRCWAPATSPSRLTSPSTHSRPAPLKRLPQQAEAPPPSNEAAGQLPVV